MKEVYRAEEGSPLVLALQDNWEAQKQLVEAINAVKEATRKEVLEEVREKIKNSMSKILATKVIKLLQEPVTEE